MLPLAERPRQAATRAREDPRRREGLALPRGARAPPRLTCGRGRKRLAAAAAAANPEFSHSPLPRMGRDSGGSLP